MYHNKSFSSIINIAYEGTDNMIIDKLNEVLNSTETYTTMHTFCYYIKSHMNEVAHMTIEEVAKHCYASKGQISKCAKHLGFHSYLEFKDACIDYSQSYRDKPIFFHKEYDLPHNAKQFADGISHAITHVSEMINYSSLNQLINDIFQSQKVYLYAQGDNRSLCNVMQVELSALYIPVVICDTDFVKDYQFEDQHLLIILSTNGTIFQLNKRIISRLIKADVKTWLITCNSSMEFSKNKLLVPSYDLKYNKFAIRYIIDILIASMQMVSKNNKQLIK